MNLWLYTKISIPSSLLICLLAIDRIYGDLTPDIFFDQQADQYVYQEYAHLSARDLIRKCGAPEEDRHGVGSICHTIVYEQPLAGTLSATISKHLCLKSKARPNNRPTDYAWIIFGFDKENRVSSAQVIYFVTSTDHTR